MASRAKRNQNLIGKKANCEQKKEPRRQENSPKSCCMMGGGSKEATGGEANHEGRGMWHQRPKISKSSRKRGDW